MHAVELLPSMAAKVERATEILLDNGPVSHELLCWIAVTAENAHAIHLKTPSRDGAVHIETIRQCVYKLRDAGLVNVTTKVRE
jgi:hypothetical protein